MLPYDIELPTKRIALWIGIRDTAMAVARNKKAKGIEYRHYINLARWANRNVILWQQNLKQRQKSS